MTSSFDARARKRPVNLTLNEDLVEQARRLTPNMSALVESLLVDFVVREQRERATRANAVQECLLVWNKFNDEKGSFADEYSSL